MQVVGGCKFSGISQKGMWNFLICVSVNVTVFGEWVLSCIIKGKIIAGDNRP